MDWFLYDNGFRHERVKSLEFSLVQEKVLIPKFNTLD